MDKNVVHDNSSEAEELIENIAPDAGAVLSNSQHSAPQAVPQPGDIDLEQARAHLEMLGVPADGVVWIETIDDVHFPDPTGKNPKGVSRGDARLKTQGPERLDDAIEHGLGRINAKGAAVYIAVNEITGPYRKTPNVSRIRAVFGEFDDGLPDRFPIEPTMLIESSRGKFHAYWACDELPGEDFDGVMARLVADYGSDNNAKDRTRILRLAGSWHMKNPDAPWQVSIVERSGKRYTREQILEAFPPIRRKHPGTDKQVRALKDGAARATAEVARIKDAMNALPQSDHDDYDEYTSIGMALHDYFEGDDDGFSIFDEWARQTPRHKKGGARSTRWRWDGFGAYQGERIHIGTLFHIARRHGWKDPHQLEAIDEVELPRETADKTAIAFGIEVMTSGADWSDDKLAELLTRMNRDHAVVPLGSNVRYLHRTVDNKGQEALQFLRADDVTALYAAITIPRGKERITAFALWRRWPKRRQYAGVGMFPPPTKEPPGYLNWWVGFAVEPRAGGDWSRFRAHIRDVICGGDEAIDTWLMDWLAHSVQKPGEKPGSSIVLKSAAKGTGKTILNTMMKRIHGVHAASVSKSEQLVGRFNGHLSRNIVLGVEEAFWAGDHAAAGALKNLITEDEIMFEQKGVDAFSMSNFTRLIFTSNERWAVPVGVDERRFMVLDVINPDANDPTYFDPIFEQMNNGGVEAMLHELLHREITANLRRPPETKALASQREHSLDTLQGWVWSVAREGEIVNPEQTDPQGQGISDARVIVLSETETTQVSCGVVIAAAKKASPGYKERTVDTGLGELLKKLGVRRRRSGGAKRPVYEFPPLAEFRAAVERELRVECQPVETPEPEPQPAGSPRPEEPVGPEPRSAGSPQRAWWMQSQKQKSPAAAQPAPTPEQLRAWNQELADEERALATRLARAKPAPGSPPNGSGDAV